MDLAHQLRGAFPFEQIPRYLLRGRDKIFGDEFGRQVRGMDIEEVLSAPRSPWQRAYVERLIGSIRRECLDHVIFCRDQSAPNPDGVFFLLSRDSSSPVAGEGLAGTAGSASAGVG
jgi:transposase InsO family protein